MSATLKLGYLLPADYSPTVIIVGNGPVGVHCANSLLQMGWKGHIQLFGRSPNKAYKRQYLQAFIQGKIDSQALRNNPLRGTLMRQHLQNEVVAIDPLEQQVTDNQGQKHYYDHLILATGASIEPDVLNPQQLQGVFALRNLQHARQLLESIAHRTHIAVLGHDTFALETANTMQRYAPEVTLIDETPAAQQCHASRALHHSVRDLGINVKSNTSITGLIGNNQLEGITLSQQEHINADALVITSKLSANTRLAQQAGIKVADGILVDWQMQTNIPHIYAVGECSQQQAKRVDSIELAMRHAEQLATQLIRRGELPLSTQGSNTPGVNENVVNG